MVWRPAIVACPELQSNLQDIQSKLMQRLSTRVGSLQTTLGKAEAAMMAISQHADTRESYKKQLLELNTKMTEINDAAPMRDGT